MQAVVQLTYSFSISERNQWSAASPTEKLQSLDEVLSLVIRSLEASQLYNDEIQASCSNIPIVLKQGQEPMATNMDINLLQNEVRAILILLKNYLNTLPIKKKKSHTINFYCRYNLRF